MECKRNMSNGAKLMPNWRPRFHNTWHWSEHRRYHREKPALHAMVIAKQHVRFFHFPFDIEDPHSAISSWIWCSFWLTTRGRLFPTQHFWNPHVFQNLQGICLTSLVVVLSKHDANFNLNKVGRSCGGYTEMIHCLKSILLQSYLRGVALWPWWWFGSAVQEQILTHHILESCSRQHSRGVTENNG